MKKGRFLWSAHRITEKQKAGKARNIKGKQLKNSRSTVSKQLVARRSSASDNIRVGNKPCKKEYKEIHRKVYFPVDFFILFFNYLMFLLQIFSFHRKSAAAYLIHPAQHNKCQRFMVFVSLKIE